MPLRARLKAIMEQRGVSQTELSKRTGLATSTVSRILAGSQKPSGETLRLIGRAVGLSVDDLLGASEIKPLSSRERLATFLEELQEELRGNPNPGIVPLISAESASTGNFLTNGECPVDEADTYLERPVAAEADLFAFSSALRREPDEDEPHGLFLASA